MEAETAEPFVSTAVGILTIHRRGRRGRWAHLTASSPAAGVSAAAGTAILFNLRRKPVLALRFFTWALRPAKSSHTPPLRSPDGAFFAAAAHIAASCRRRAEALAVLRIAVRRIDSTGGGGEGPAGNAGCRLLLNALARSYRAFDSAPLVFDALVLAYIDAHRVDRALDVARRLQSRGIPMNSKTSNSLLRAVGHALGADACLELFRELSENQQSPNVDSYNILLLALHRAGRREEIDDLLARMKKAGCRRNVYTYAVLIGGCCDRVDTATARSLWEEMIGEGIEPDVIIYNTLIGGFCNAGLVVDAERLVKEMQRRGVEPNEATLEHLVGGHCEVEDVDAALLVRKAMKRREFGMSASALEGVVVELCGHGRVDEAAGILREEAKREGFVPSRRSYEAVMSGLCEEGNVEAAGKVQAEMAGKGMESGEAVYGWFIGAYAKSGDDETVRKLKKEMLQLHGTGS